MNFDKKLLEILACPVAKGKLEYDAEKNELISQAVNLAYPILEGIPVLIEDEARVITLAEKE
ncbi:Trm112 family protein [Algibacillus agarilyticus]|uniref:Trm112 family protein n=1 Tax=Algibacillus agarilyticus TaxID=2234133 RepID=UPI000DCF6CDE|nr:Trm112 family protein [Algibacillus agarilyticus]